MRESERERCRNFEKPRKQNGEKFRSRLARTKNFCAWRVGDCHSRASDQARSKEKPSTSPGRLTPARYWSRRKTPRTPAPPGGEETQSSSDDWRGEGTAEDLGVVVPAQDPCVSESETGECQISETATSGQRGKFGQKAVCVFWNLCLDAVSLGRNRLDQL